MILFLLIEPNQTICESLICALGIIDSKYHVLHDVTLLARS